MSYRPGYYAERRAAGRCARCPAISGAASLCPSCNAANSAARKQRYQERKAARVCVDCAAPLDPRDDSRCFDCCDAAYKMRRSA